MDAAKQAGLEGWELDHMLYRFRDCILDGLEDAEDLVAARKASKEKTIPWGQGQTGAKSLAYSLVIRVNPWQKKLE